MDAEDWDERYRAAELVWSVEPNRFVEAEVAGLPPGRALDLAAGEGRNALWLAAQGWQVEAVDFSPVALDKGRSLAEQRGLQLTWTRADLTASPPLEPADLVLLAYLQLPRARMAPVVAWAAGLVRPGGTLLVVGHAPRNLTDGYGGPSDADVLHGPDELRDDLAGSGLEVLHAGEVLRPVETDEGAATAIDVLVRARRPVDGFSGEGAP